MDYTKTDIFRHLERLHLFLESSQNILPASLKQQIEKELGKLSGQVEKIEKPVLNVGLLGGTGVGKSTIINELAGDKISSVSDRRPHTELIVVYRHRNTPLPADIPQEHLKSPHLLHEKDSIAGLIIYDFPDFDSIFGEHAEKVFRLLEFLDIAIWVVSPEKYADLEFYRVLEKASKHQDNFIFVMNKVDTIKSPDTDPGAKLKTLIGDFALKLKKHGISAPRIYSFAAREINNATAPDWCKEDFYNFRDNLFRKRDRKEILAIKEANLEVEIRHLTRDFKKLFARYRKLPSELDTALTDFRTNFTELAQSAPVLTRQLITEKTLFTLREEIMNTSPDIAPVAFFKRILSRAVSRKRVTGAPNGLESNLPDQNISFTTVKNIFKTAIYRINTVLHRYGIDASSGKLANLEMEIDKELSLFLNESKQNFFEFTRTLQQPEAGIRVLLRKLKQKIYLTVPAFFLLISLMGIASLKEFCLHPSVSKALSLLFNVVLSLYTPSGLISLLSFLIIELVLIILLSVKSIKSDEKELEIKVQTLNEHLSMKLIKCLETLKNRIDKAVEEIKNEIRGADSILKELDALKT